MRSAMTGNTMTTRNGRKFGLRACLAGALLTLPGLALADVNDGVAAWERGDYETAVAEWRGPAGQGDADAQFNLGQAYRLGRGVEQNTRQAEVYYAKAAAQGHLKAADNLGLLLFQNGRREEAMPYVVDAAERGDPRAQYLLGIAHFNGDLVARDWVRAYALITLANAAGLPQAASAMQQMDTHIPLDQRQQAQALVPQLKRNADAQRASRFAAADLGASDAAPSRSAPVPAAAPPVATSAPGVPPPGRPDRIPRPITQTRVAPSVAAAQSAIAEASRVTGTESPADAGATFARRSTPAAADPRAVEPQPTTSVVARAAPQPRPEPRVSPRPEPQPVRAATGSGPWKIQLGAFAVNGNAERLWARLSGRSELAGATRVLEPAGRVTKLLAGGYASRDAAQSACNALKRSGQDCLVTR